MPSNKVHIIAYAALLHLLTAGCSQSEWGTLKGVVKLGGAPVGPGTILLTPVEGDGPGAMAVFGEDGGFSVMSSGRKEGAPAAEYRVTIRGGDALSEEANPRAKTNIPPRYAQPDVANLTVKIEPGENTQDFQLEP
jgi:hypothetical protein